MALTKHGEELYKLGLKLQEEVWPISDTGWKTHDGIWMPKPVDAEVAKAIHPKQPYKGWLCAHDGHYRVSGFLTGVFIKNAGHTGFVLDEGQVPKMQVKVKGGTQKVAVRYLVASWQQEAVTNKMFMALELPLKIMIEPGEAVWVAGAFAQTDPMNVKLMAKNRHTIVVSSPPDKNPFRPDNMEALDIRYGEGVFTDWQQFVTFDQVRLCNHTSFHEDCEGCILTAPEPTKKLPKKAGGAGAILKAGIVVKAGSDHFWNTDTSNVATDKQMEKMFGLHEFHHEDAELEYQVGDDDSGWEKNPNLVYGATEKTTKKNLVYWGKFKSPGAAWGWTRCSSVFLTKALGSSLTKADQSMLIDHDGIKCQACQMDPKTWLKFDNPFDDDAYPGYAYFSTMNWLEWHDVDAAGLQPPVSLCGGQVYAFLGHYFYLKATGGWWHTPKTCKVCTGKMVPFEQLPELTQQWLTQFKSLKDAMMSPESGLPSWTLPQLTDPAPVFESVGHDQDPLAPSAGVFELLTKMGQVSDVAATYYHNSSVAEPVGAAMHVFSDGTGFFISDGMVKPSAINKLAVTECVSLGSWQKLPIAWQLP